MGWIEEHGEDFEVPGVVEFLVERKIVEDMSFNQDASPSFGVMDDENDRQIQLWVDHPITRMRENEGKRFVVLDIHPVDADKPQFEKETDDLDEALGLLFDRLAEFHGHEGSWKDPEAYLEEVLKDFSKE